MKFTLILPALASIATLLATPAFADANDAEVRTVMGKAVDDVFRPGYAAFAASARDMSTAMENLCQSPAETKLDEARTTFGVLIDTWSKIEVLQDGPVIRENRLERILFYPDRKGLALRQIQDLLADEDDAAISPEAMPQKSVAVQGIPALEFVLFGAGAEAMATTNNTYRCRVGTAISNNLGLLADQLVALWDAPNGIAKDWKEPGPDNTIYRTSDEAMTGLLGVLVHGVEQVLKHRIAYFYAEDGDIVKPKKAIYRRSGNTFRSIKANLEGLQAIWRGSDMQGIIKGDASAITTDINFDFKSAIATAQALDLPIADVLKNEKLLSKLAFLELTLEDLETRLNDDYGRAIGLAAGFSFSDGD